MFKSLVEIKQKEYNPFNAIDREIAELNAGFVWSEKNHPPANLPYKCFGDIILEIEVANRAKLAKLVSKRARIEYIYELHKTTVITDEMLTDEEDKIIYTNMVVDMLLIKSKLEFKE